MKESFESAFLGRQDLLPDSPFAFAVKRAALSDSQKAAVNDSRIADLAVIKNLFEIILDPGRDSNPILPILRRKENTIGSRYQKPFVVICNGVQSPITGRQQFQFCPSFRFGLLIPIQVRIRAADQENASNPGMQDPGFWLASHRNVLLP
jgi:hypothetical protein